MGLKHFLNLAVTWRCNRRVWTALSHIVRKDDKTPSQSIMFMNAQYLTDSTIPLPSVCTWITEKIRWKTYRVSILPLVAPTAGTAGTVLAKPPNGTIVPCTGTKMLVRSIPAANPETTGLHNEYSVLCMSVIGHENTNKVLCISVIGSPFVSHRLLMQPWVQPCCMHMWLATLSALQVLAPVRRWRAAHMHRQRWYCSGGTDEDQQELWVQVLVVMQATPTPVHGIRSWRRILTYAYAFTGIAYLYTDQGPWILTDCWKGHGRPWWAGCHLKARDPC
jgi:hypothetical protein